MITSEGLRMETVTLSNGMEIPLLGFGTYQLDENATAAAVLAALKAGYRLIDTAQYYGNEQTVGQAIRQSGIGRDQLFITTKTPLSGYAEAKAGVDDSLMACGVDYIDLMLIHWPVPNFMETYEALEDAVKEGKVRALGLSNFNAAQVQRVLDEARVKPVLDQVETHLLWQQAKLHAYLTAHDLVHQAWSPLGQGTPAILNSPALLALGAKYHKTPAQVALRFLIEEGVAVIPKAQHLAHLKENLAVFDFQLTEEERAQLRQADQRRSVEGWPQSMQVEADY